jgi:Bacterial EndoU nuclease
MKTNQYKYFFLNEKDLHYSDNKLIGNPQIIKFDPSMFWLMGLSTPSPSYSSIEKLIKSDKRFKEFSKRKHSTSKLLAMEENITLIKDAILTSESDDNQAGNMIRHIVEGNRMSKDFTGIHHITDPLPYHIKNYQEIAPPNEKGVYVASFEVVKNGKTLRKEKESTMFPKNWSNQRVYDECKYALENRIQDKAEPRLYKSVTLSGIPVEMYFDDNGKIKTLYPIRE